MANLRWWGTAFAVLLVSAATAISAPVLKFKTLVNFDGTNGSGPQSSLVQGRDGNFYGTTEDGGAHGLGTVFKISQYGVLTILYSFCAKANCRDGLFPVGALVLANDGSFYGTTMSGGSSNNCNQSGCGTVFRITPQGALTTLHSFDSTDGTNPQAALIVARSGDFYGTTLRGGSSALCGLQGGCGTVFRITPAGMLTTVYNFCSQAGCPDGQYPYGAVVQGFDGNLYGTTNWGGNESCNPPVGCGTVFKMTPGGTLKTIHIFDSTDGSGPYDSLVEAMNGDFYGTTFSGGSAPGCTADAGCGTVFEINARGMFRKLLSFDVHGPNNPWAGLVQATDGNFYGTTYYGGAFNDGAVFEVTPLGKATTVHGFNLTDGADPYGGLLQGTAGNFYGTTSTASDGPGTIFEFSTGLGPFVAFVRGDGRVGQTFGILGQGFTGTTGISLNGIPTSFTVVSPTFIKATVPLGATTGFVVVTTPGSKLTSNVPFQVIP